ncbi:NAD(P) transhydrogenase subunit alpha [Tistlia consotensis]|uniref:NAD(P) transhydrogenase subunit alpha n=1 Tax=Tistlia consotensis USBA 355 TaxID=560819 RepID=A0A1Y6CGF8_9PROT|nr:Re/Si-specific NAD(P)(+) transhydrogenase subunit alpha [Tistlia consotensis]SMF60559.1 NAD(P) transhydrogenase subunit alpha [Tistlia consotensis USBA 355]SNR93275.1 NAD(P) transhydrogenase subunit alpha [Tistlia consotensis]
MKIAILKERRPGEARVAATPEVVKKYLGLGFEIAVETGAGDGASLPDSLYEQAGATLAKDAKAALAGAGIALKVQRPTAAEAKAFDRGTLLLSLVDPYRAGAELKALADAGITAFAMEFMPRITRAQSMDVLSSQANLAGYKAVIDAAGEFGRAFPLMMTAAGRVNPAQVLVMGAGVAGLQAIATARRLGAVVHATDVRPAAKEQVESLGAKFVAVEDEEFKQAETAGGYAKEMSDAYKKKQAELTAETIKKMDIVITTALIPGRPAPKLISAEMVESMKPGSVIVDLAVETGGNCELSEPDRIAVKHGVKIIGHRNLPARLATDTSQLYATNLFNLVSLLWDKAEKKLAVDWDDEIVKSTVVTRDGEIVHPNLEQVKAELAKAGGDAPAEPAAAKKAPVKKAPAKKAPAKKAAAKPAAPQPGASETPGGTPGETPGEVPSEDRAAGDGQGPAAQEAEKNGK